MTVTITEEQREAADNLRESMRIFNNAIRMAAYSGLHVEMKLCTAPTGRHRFRRSTFSRNCDGVQRAEVAEPNGTARDSYFLPRYAITFSRFGPASRIASSALCRDTFAVFIK